MCCAFNYKNNYMSKFCITGHRPHKLGNDYELTSPLIKKIECKLQDIITLYAPEYMISGMALGIDTLWAKLAIENNIKLIAAITCGDHPNKWPKKSQSIYYRLLDKAHQVVNVSSKVNWQPGCENRRNIWMVRQLDSDEDKLVAVWDGSSGGTANCVNFAKNLNRSIIFINPKEV